MPSGRPILNIALDESTAAALRAYTDQRGVTVTGLFEGFARSVIAPTARTPRWLAEILTVAREVDAERRNRRR